MGSKLFGFVVSKSRYLFTDGNAVQWEAITVQLIQRYVRGE